MGMGAMKMKRRIWIEVDGEEIAQILPISSGYYVPQFGQCYLTTQEIISYLQANKLSGRIKTENVTDLLAHWRKQQFGHY